MPQYPCQKKKGNLERHYNAPHSNKYDADFPPKSEIHQLELKELKSKLAAQQLMAKQGSLSNNATISSNLFVKKK
jgi:hypothetical protein